VKGIIGTKMDDNRISWVTLKSEPERPDEIILEVVVQEERIITHRQNELGDEQEDE
jgi:hypothetical protein